MPDSAISEHQVASAPEDGRSAPQSVLQSPQGAQNMPPAVGTRSSGQQHAVMQNLTRNIGSELAKIGQGLKETMAALKQGEQARLRADGGKAE